MTDTIANVRQLLEGANAVSVLSGAGISAESGIPTFRGAGGIWENRQAIELATPDAFREDPHQVWRFYQWRRQKVAEARPNPGHFALVDLERQVSSFQLITQNVDGLHRLAGNQAVVEVHGSLWLLRCMDCGEEHEDRETSSEAIPRCERCGGMERPGVVWFGEALKSESIIAMEEAATMCDVLLVVGTSAVVYPAAGMIELARQVGAAIVEVNTEDTPATAHADLTLRGPSGILLPQVVRQL